MSIREEAGAVPSRYRGVWRRSLLETPYARDTATTVFWLQTSGWHADIRIPAGRPDFAGVSALEACSSQQLAWLAGQEGFAGITQVERRGRRETCTWHRMADYQPPAAVADAGIMQFEPDRLVETGVHMRYLEHWRRLPDSQEGYAVLRLRSSQPATPAQFLMVAGSYVMHVRDRRIAWPGAIAATADIGSLPLAMRCAWLDVEISFGRRTRTGWTITHSTLPWKENRAIDLCLTPVGPGLVEMLSAGACTTWDVLEWTPPRSEYRARNAHRA